MRKTYYGIGLFLLISSTLLSVFSCINLSKQKGELLELQQEVNDTSLKLNSTLSYLSKETSANQTSTLDTDEDSYMLKVAQDYVDVYYLDGTTLYEKTNIPFRMLPSDVQSEIKDGKSIHSLEEVYGFLETYSS